MTRRVFTFLLVPAMRAIADERTDILDILAPLAAALAAGDPEGFLSGFDRKMARYDDLASWVRALTGSYDITSSVDLLEVRGSDIDLDWSMRLRSRVLAAQSDDRRQTITIQLGKNKKITSLKPLEFFQDRPKA